MTDDTTKEEEEEEEELTPSGHMVSEHESMLPPVGIMQFLGEDPSVPSSSSSLGYHVQMQHRHQGSKRCCRPRRCCCCCFRRFVKIRRACLVPLIYFLLVIGGMALFAYTMVRLDLFGGDGGDSRGDPTKGEFGWNDGLFAARFESTFARQYAGQMMIDQQRGRVRLDFWHERFQGSVYHSVLWNLTRRTVAGNNTTSRTAWIATDQFARSFYTQTSTKVCERVVVPGGALVVPRPVDGITVIESSPITGSDVPMELLAWKLGPNLDEYDSVWMLRGLVDRVDRRKHTPWAVAVSNGRTNTTRQEVSVFGYEAVDVADDYWAHYWTVPFEDCLFSPNFFSPGSSLGKKVLPAWLDQSLAQRCPDVFFNDPSALDALKAFLQGRYSWQNCSYLSWSSDDSRRRTVAEEGGLDSICSLLAFDRHRRILDDQFSQLVAGSCWLHNELLTNASRFFTNSTQQQQLSFDDARTLCQGQLDVIGCLTFVPIVRNFLNCFACDVWMEHPTLHLPTVKQAADMPIFIPVPVIEARWNPFVFAAWPTSLAEMAALDTLSTPTNAFM